MRYRSFADPLIEVVLPTNYDPAKCYRVLYLLSRCGSKDVDSLREILRLKLHDRHNRICVLPEGRNEDYLKNVVAPYVEKRCSTLGNAEGRLLIGFSKTGTGAFRLILENPDYVGYAVGWDGPFMDGKRPENPRDNWRGTTPTRSPSERVWCSEVVRSGRTAGSSITRSSRSSASNTTSRTSSGPATPGSPGGWSRTWPR